MKVRGRHWIFLWLLLFLGVAGAIVTRQREALAVARRLSVLRDRSNELKATRAELERAIKAATSRQVLVPRMERAGLHQPSDLENTSLPMDSLTSRKRPD